MFRYYEGILSHINEVVYRNITPDYRWLDAEAVKTILKGTSPHITNGENVYCNHLTPLLIQRISVLIPDLVTNTVKVLGFNSDQHIYKTLLQSKRFYPPTKFNYHYAVGLGNPTTDIFDPILLPSIVKVGCYLREAFFNCADLRMMGVLNKPDL